jgi:beta-N-acetylhexosaminidase
MRVLATVFLLAGLTACAADVAEPSAFAGPDGKADDPLGATGLERDDVGQLFLVEHYEVDVYPSVRAKMSTTTPGGVLFWNANRADASALREVIRTYSEVASNADKPPVLFSADYEGGAHSLAPSGRRIPGVQRFTNGFTPLAHPAWIGVAFDEDEELGLELAELHGEIMAKELRSAGLNFPLSVIGDLGNGLFSVRGLHDEPEIVAVLLTHITQGFLSEEDLVFNTKHFPGLGQTRGDTHDEVVVSPITDPAEAERHLMPFRAYTEHVNATETWSRATIMNSHAVFPAFDPDHNTTTSRIVLNDVLREDVGFRGLAVSDAMWMGPYGSLSGDALYRVYLTSFLAGMDMLMIPGAKFSGALSYFEKVFDGSVSAAEQERIVTATELASFDEVRERFFSRMRESLARLRSTQAAIRPAHEVMDAAGTEPTTRTTEQSARYYEILQSLPGFQ